MATLCSVKECMGCGACYNICPKNAISMQEDKEGFLYPMIDQVCCIDCKRCEKVCPILNPIKKHDRSDKPLAVMSRSEGIRQKSSSGGMFSLLASYVLKNDGAVFGAAFETDYTVIHTSAKNEKDLENLRGSKYLQSDTKRTYSEVKVLLKENRMVLYTGTPCQIAGLYGFLGNANTDKLITADLVCHGVPSALAFKTYIRKLAEKKGLNVTDIRNFRFRELERWGITPSFQFAKAKIHMVTPEENLYMRLFLSSRLHRESCYHCKFTTPERVGDITMADFWGIGNNAPYDRDTSKGCSLVLANTDKGRRILSELSNEIYIDEREWEEALKHNTQLHTTSIRPKDRDEVFTYLVSHDYDTTYNHFFNTPYIRFRRMVGRILRALHLR